MAKDDRTYLIVDDAPRVRQTLQSYLEDLEVPPDRINIAEDGDAALTTFREEKPDVVFMDISMPGVDGEEATQTMLTEEPDTKVVVVTGKTRDDEQATRLVSLGAFAFVSKPFRRDDIRGVLQDIDTDESGAGRIQ